MKEMWKAIPGLEGLYEASTHGQIRSHDRLDSIGRQSIGQILKPLMGDNGPFVVPSKGGKPKARTVAEYVATTFLGPKPEGGQVCHIDGDLLNNRLDNLQYIVDAVATDESAPGREYTGIAALVSGVVGVAVLAFIRFLSKSQGRKD